MPVSSINCLTAASARFGALSERTLSGMPNIAKVCRKAITTSIEVSALHACSITYLDLSSCRTKILVAPLKSQGVEIVTKSMCQRPKIGASVIMVLYIA